MNELRLASHRQAMLAELGEFDETQGVPNLIRFGASRFPARFRIPEQGDDFIERGSAHPAHQGCLGLTRSRRCVAMRQPSESDLEASCPD